MCRIDAAAASYWLSCSRGRRRAEPGQNLHCTIALLYSKCRSVICFLRVVYLRQANFDTNQCEPSALAAEDTEAGTGSCGINDVAGTHEQVVISAASVTEAATAAAAAIMFDDMLDLTDSQLCQLDDVARSVDIHYTSNVVHLTAASRTAQFGILFNHKF